MNLAGSTITERISYLRTLPAIRERCTRVHRLAQKGKVEYFQYSQENEQEAVDFCVELIQRDFGTHLDRIPPHGRWRHLDAGRSRVGPLISQWKHAAAPPDDRETCKRLIDLFLVSVLLDAGAGNVWAYTEPGTDDTYARSEGLGVASMHMFQNGFFSGDSHQPHRVDAAGLARITADSAAAALQVGPANPMSGLEGRAQLLYKLGTALQASPAYFGADARPGNLIDFLELESIGAAAARRVHVAALWHALIEGLAPIWPASRTTLGGVPLGDVWPCAALRGPSIAEGDDLVPFHKLTGWLTYSLLEPLQKILGWTFDGLEDLTGLPEYRNGGLLVDFGVLSLRPGALPASCYPDPNSPIPRLPPSHPAVVEWRAMTVIELDRLADAIRTKLGPAAANLTLAQVLESATWKGGREIARRKRPDTGGPPIEIESDGTVF